MQNPDLSARRPLKSRGLPVFKNCAARLANAGVSPNTISFMSMVFGCGAGAAFAATPYVTGWELHACWLAAAAGIQLRLIANLLDGMVAVEGRKGGPTGELWNEAPDRVSDAAIFIGAGYAMGSSPILGFAAALTAFFVAYVRALGASVGAGQCFLGPQAKPQRMFVMTLSCILLALLPASLFQPVDPRPLFFHLQDTYYEISNIHLVITLLPLALAVVIIGGIITAWRRLRHISAFLRTSQS